MIFLSEPENFNPRFQVVGCYLKCNDNILFLHRSETEEEPNKWGVPGGKIEEKEAPEDAVRRELFEETGIDLQPQDFLFYKKIFVRFPSADIIYHMFEAKTPSQPAVILDAREHQNFRWILPSDALSLELMEDEDKCLKMLYNI